jgi:hypothetical protein
MDLIAKTWIESRFPGLAISSYQITSPAMRRYNCIAWAAKDEKNWWWPTGPYWPGDADREATIPAFIQAFRSLGYEPCDSITLEPSIEKLAIFVDSNGTVTHMARQLENGAWTSKLGEGHDISHQLEAVCGTVYGRVAQILRRLRR